MVAVLLMAGDHVPSIPLVDVVGKLNVPPSQIAGIGSNSGTTLSLIVISITVGIPHGLSGVNVYGVVPGVVTSIVDGDQLPENPLSEIVGNEGGGTPEQNGPIGAKLATT